MGNTVCEFNRVFDAMCDAVCCCHSNDGNKGHSNYNYVCTKYCCCVRKQLRSNQDNGFRDNYGDVHCAYNDDYTIDTVCIQGQSMILPPNESTIEPFIADFGGSMGEADLWENIRGSLGGNVIYKQPQWVSCSIIKANSRTTQSCTVTSDNTVFITPEILTLADSDRGQAGCTPPFVWFRLGANLTP